MVAAGTAIATRSAAEKAITCCDIVTIQSTKYMEEEARALKRSLVAATKSVPTTVGGGAHGHIYLLESVTEYTAKGVDAGYTKAPAPTGITFTTGATAAVLTQEKENAVDKAETYHTQEGSWVGLHKAIPTNVPRETIIELVDPGLSSTKSNLARSSK